MSTEVKFKIIDIDTSQHSIIVRYFSDILTEDDLATSFIYDENNHGTIQRRPDGSPVRCQTDYNISIWKTPTPDVKEILKIAENNAPHDWFKLKHDILSDTIDTSMANVVSVIGQTFVANVIVQQALSENDIINLIDSLTSNSSNNI